MITLHRPMQRLALLGAAFFALAALAGVPAARAATPSADHKTPAATPPFLRQMARALTRVHSYQVTVQTTSAGHGRPVTTTSTETRVRRGTTVRFHITANMRRAGQMSTVEEVFTGTHLCLRTRARGAWMCQAAQAGALARLSATSATQIARLFSPRQRYVAVGRQPRQGQVCTGYRFALAGSGLRG